MGSKMYFREDPPRDENSGNEKYAPADHETTPADYDDADAGGPVAMGIALALMLVLVVFVLFLVLAGILVAVL